MLPDVLRRLAATLSIVALLAVPVVAGTRLFCKYTGIEITGCAEQAVAVHATLRDEGCCDRRTFERIGSTVPSPATELPPPVLAAIAELPRSVLLALRERPDPAQVPADAGPPAFLSHRALLI
jgi:hypothetical protein